MGDAADIVKRATREALRGQARIVEDQIAEVLRGLGAPIGTEAMPAWMVRHGARMRWGSGDQRFRHVLDFPRATERLVHPATGAVILVHMYADGSHASVEEPA